jgi:hypothetical protein
MTFITPLTQVMLINTTYGAPGPTHTHPEIKTFCIILFPKYCQSSVLQSNSLFYPQNVLERSDNWVHSLAPTL